MKYLRVEKQKKLVRGNVSIVEQKMVLEEFCFKLVRCSYSKDPSSDFIDVQI